MEPLICAKVCARPGDPGAIRPGQLPRRLYQLKQLFQSHLVISAPQMPLLPSSSLPQVPSTQTTLGTLRAAQGDCPDSTAPWLHSVCHGFAQLNILWPKALRCWITRSSERLHNRLFFTSSLFTSQRNALAPSRSSS